MNLCYVNGNCAYFSNKLARDVIGDDWDDPGEFGSPPYTDTCELIYFTAGKDYVFGGDFDNVSVNDVNVGLVPWLAFKFDNEQSYHKLMANCGIEEFKSVIKGYGGVVYVKEVD